MTPSPSSTVRICECCHQPETAATLSCHEVEVPFCDGIVLPPIRFDPAAGLFEATAMGTLTVTEARAIYMQRGLSGCPLCGVSAFGFHHVGCAAERCPRCGLTLMRACRCKAPTSEEL